jgi:hypothetical protein
LRDAVEAESKVREVFKNVSNAIRREQREDFIGGI